MPDNKTRLDLWIVQHGYTDSREKARHLIENGQVRVGDRTITKPSYAVAEDDTVLLLGEAPRYVGRGGYKLEAAIQAAGLSLTDKTALDVGASTGGFTQCMLEYGAKKVVAVDVGSGQLHATLREDPRVCSLESTDIRNTEAIAPYMPQGGFAFASVDVSFISLSMILEAVAALLCDKATLVCLIKPQFEVGKSYIGKGGIVKDLKQHRRILCEYAARFAAWHWDAVALLPSPILGGDGNGEYLAVLQKAPADQPITTFSAENVENAVAAMQAMKSDRKRRTTP